MRHHRPLLTFAAAAATTLTAFAAPPPAAEAASKVPCTRESETRHECTFYRPGNGFSGGSIVVAGGTVVGYLPAGENWVVCQQIGADVYNEAGNRNRWYAWTTAENGRQGWVSPLDARGGSDFGAFAGVPNCHGLRGPAPGTPGRWVSRPPVPAPTGPSAPQPGGTIKQPTMRPIRPLRQPRSKFRLKRSGSRLGLGGSGGGLVLPVLRAGTALMFDGSGGMISRCTSGFSVRSATGAPTVLSAGHCNDPAASGRRAYRPIGTTLYALGNVAANAYTGFGSVDALSIPVRAPWRADRLIERGGQRSLLASGVMPTTHQAPGRRVCFSGVTSVREQCGKITERLPDGPICTTAIVRHGDSGAPVYEQTGGRTTRAAGLASFYTFQGDNDPGFGPMCYQPLQEAMAAVGARW